MNPLTRIMLIASILLSISSVDARPIDSDSPEYQVIKNAAREYAVVLGSPTEIDGYTFEKNSLSIKTKRANIVQEVAIELPVSVQITSCKIVGNRLSVTYKEVVDIASDVAKAEHSGYVKGAVVGGLSGFVGGSVFMLLAILLL